MAALSGKAQQTALITGASSGIGAELARLFAADGIGLVLVARNAERLHAYADELRARYGVEATVVVQDLAEPNAAMAVFQSVREQGIGIDYLVNNAGVGVQGAFAEIPLDRQLSMMHLNMDALVTLSHCFLPEMLARRTGKILNVASLAGLQPGGPGAAAYYASKAFVLSFSRGLSVELRGSGVSVTALCPGPVATHFAEGGSFEKTVLYGDWVMGRPDKVAAAGFRAMHQDKMLCVPGLLAQLLALGARMAPVLALAVNGLLLKRRD